MIKRAVINIIFQFIFICSFAQKVEIPHFQKIYTIPDNQKFLDILEKDTSIILLGSTINNTTSYIEVMNVNRKNGNINSSFLIGNSGERWNPYQFLYDSNNDLWILAENDISNHAYTHLMKIGEKDTVEFDIKIGTDSTYQRMNFVTESNGYFYMTGTYSEPSMSFGNDFWVVKASLDGNIIWDKHFGIDTVNEVASSLQVVDDKIYVYGDKNKPNFIYNPYVITLDTAGNFISDTPLDWPFNCGFKISCITKDNIYVTGESSTSTSSWFDIFLDKYDLQGNRIWRKMLPGSNNSETGFDIKMYEGYLYITGYAYNPSVNNTDMHCTVIDTSGNIKEQRFYNLGNVDVGYQILPTNKGGFYIAGTGSKSFDTEYMLVFDTTSLLTNTTNIEKNINDNVIIYPNPGKTPHLELPSKHNYFSISIYNLQGELVLERGIKEKNNIALPIAISGVYLAKISNNNSIITKKIIIQ